MQFEYLKSHKELNVNSQLSNAQRDEVWLVLPTNILALNNSFVEYSARLEMSDIIDYTMCFKYVLNSELHAKIIEEPIPNHNPLLS
ncbi:MAG: hypothetical protein KKF62_10805 [Bacteroidetes bacterium]|nr:hypothetical protein [Bacteroidota bacterium]MBU1116959.1 hypothetical protein [Bacteroidota bacterium]MBU1799132.1 hypothetical protein [Bacteroidota bacterium]